MSDSSAQVVIRGRIGSDSGPSESLRISCSNRTNGEPVTCINAFEQLIRITANQFVSVVRTVKGGQPIRGGGIVGDDPFRNRLNMTRSTRKGFSHA